MPCQLSASERTKVWCSTMEYWQHLYVLLTSSSIRRNTYTRYPIRRLMVFRSVPFNLKKKGGLGWRPEGHLSLSRCYTRNEMTRWRLYIYIYIHILLFFQSYYSLWLVRVEEIWRGERIRVACWRVYLLHNINSMQSISMDGMFRHFFPVPWLLQYPTYEWAACGSTSYV